MITLMVHKSLETENFVCTTSFNTYNTWFQTSSTRNIKISAALKVSVQMTLETFRLKHKTFSINQSWPLSKSLIEFLRYIPAIHFTLHLVRNFDISPFNMTLLNVEIRLVNFNSSANILKPSPIIPRFYRWFSSSLMRCTHFGPSYIQTCRLLKNL